jgi:hypothetical protein
LAGEQVITLTSVLPVRVQWKNSSTYQYQLGDPQHEELLHLCKCVQVLEPNSQRAAGAVLRNLAALKTHSVECQVHNVGLAPRPAAKRPPSAKVVDADVTVTPIAEWLHTSVSVLRSCSAALRTAHQTEIK